MKLLERCVNTLERGPVEEVKVDYIPREHITLTSALPWRGRWRMMLTIGQDFAGRQKFKSIYGASESECVERAKLFISAGKLEDAVAPKSSQTEGIMRVEYASFKEAPAWLKTFYHRAKTRAKRNAIPFRLTPDQFITLYVASRGVCMYSGMPFSPTEKAYAPSLDRIDSTKGYTLSNCRFICMMLNFAFHSWGSKPFADLVAFLTAQDRRNGTGNGKDDFEGFSGFQGKSAVP